MRHPIIYQLLPRLFANGYRAAQYENMPCEPNGTIDRNGVGKFEDITTTVLDNLARLGYTHIWYTGVLDHATQTDYSVVGQSANHPSVVKGIAGSPYAVRDYYNVDADLAVEPQNRMAEYEALIARTRAAGLKVVMDFVPNHVARNYHSVSAPDGVGDFGCDDDQSRAFAPDNNFYYCVGEKFKPQFELNGYEEMPARATGNDCFTASPSINDWYETVKLNYGVDYLGGGSQYFSPIPDTWKRMYDILMFWAAKGVDSFRCDMAEMVPVEFWHWVIAKVKEQYPDILFIAEVYNPVQHRFFISYGGFDYLYDKVGLYDTLRSLIMYRMSASAVSSAWQSVDGINCNMLSFMENHDEQRIGSEFFAASPFLPTIKNPAIRGWLATAVTVTLGRGATMIYAGQEVGEPGMESEGFSGRDGRTTIFDYWRVESLCRLSDTLNTRELSLDRFDDNQKELFVAYRDLLALAQYDVVDSGDFYDLMYLNHNNPQFDSARHLAYVRHTDSEVMLVVANFTWHEADVEVNLCDHLFCMLEMEPLEVVVAHEHFTDSDIEISFTPSFPVKLHLPPFGMVALRFSK